MLCGVDSPFCLDSHWRAALEGKNREHMRKVIAFLILGSAGPLMLASCAGLGHEQPVTAALPETAQIAPVAPIEHRAQPLEPSEKGSEAPLTVTRDGALLTALLNNREIDVARLGPRIGETYAPEARAAFDPQLLSTISMGHATRPPSAASMAGASTAYSGTSTASGSTTPLDSIRQVLTQMDKLITTLEQANPGNIATDSADGSVTIQQMFPTGTEIYLTGEASSVDVHGAADDYQGSWSFGVTQPLLEGAGRGVNLVALRQAKNREAQSRYVFRGDVLDIVKQVELAYWNLALAYEVEKIRQFAVQLADEQLQRNEELLRVGKAIEGDVMAARAEKASRAADLMDAQAAIRDQNIAMVRLLNPRAEDPWKTTFQTVDGPEVAQAELDPVASEQRAVAYRPELAEARLDVENAKLGQTQARNDLLPRLDLVGSYGRTSQGTASSAIGKHLDDGEYDNYQIGLQLQTPILNRAEKARYRRSKLTTTQLERNLGSLEQLIGADVRQAIVEAERQWQRIGAAEEEKQSREEQLRVAQGRNEKGKTTNLDLLLVQRDYIQAQVDSITAKVGYIQALTNLYAAEGTLLERRGISLEREEAAGSL